MKQAIYAPTVHDYGDARQLVTLAVEAERAGFDGFFIWDVLFMHQGVDTADATVTLGAIAQATERVRIGAMITPVARRRPWKLAKELMTLDRLSDGRLTLGIGLGEPADLEFENVGEDGSGKGRAQRLDEGLEVLEKFLSAEPVEHDGTHYRVRGSLAVPGCVQTPRIPIWGGAALPMQAGMRRASRYDGIFPIEFPGDIPFREDGSIDMSATWLSAARFAELVKGVSDARADRHQGIAGYDFVASGVTDPADAGAATELAAYRDAGATWWFEWLDDRPGSYAAALERVRRGPVGAR